MVGRVHHLVSTRGRRVALSGCARRNDRLRVVSLTCDSRVRYTGGRDASLVPRKVFLDAALALFRDE